MKYFAKFSTFLELFSVGSCGSLMLTQLGSNGKLALFAQPLFFQFLNHQAQCNPPDYHGSIHFGHSSMWYMSRCVMIITFSSGLTSWPPLIGPEKETWPILVSEFRRIWDFVLREPL